MAYPDQQELQLLLVRDLCSRRYHSSRTKETAKRYEAEILLEYAVDTLSTPDLALQNSHLSMPDLLTPLFLSLSASSLSFFI